MRIGKEALFCYTFATISATPFLWLAWMICKLFGHITAWNTVDQNITILTFVSNWGLYHRLHAREIRARVPLNCIHKTPHNSLQQHKAAIKRLEKYTNAVLLKAWKMSEYFHEMKWKGMPRLWKKKKTNLWVSRTKLIPNVRCSGGLRINLNDLAIYGVRADMLTRWTFSFTTSSEKRPPGPVLNHCPWAQQRNVSATEPPWQVKLTHTTKSLKGLPRENCLIFEVDFTTKQACLRRH